MATSVGIAAGALALAIAIGPVEAQQQAAVRVPVSVLEQYAGEYDQNGTTIRVVLSGDTLFRETAGQRVVLWPISETLFQMGPNFTAEFVIDAAGGVTQVITNNVAIEYRIRRKGSPPAPATATAVPDEPVVRVPRSVLERYVGEYEYVPGQMSRTDLRIVVRLQGDTLTRWIGEEQVLTPISETRFRIADTSLTVEFVIDEAGVMQVLGSSGSRQLLARLNPQR